MMKDNAPERWCIIQISPPRSPSTITITIYHYDHMGYLITETTETGALIKDYLWEEGMHPIAQIDNTQGTEQVLYLYTDHLMTNRLATDQTQAVVWRWEGEAFGNTAADEIAGFSVNLRFPGQYFDQETNLHYNWNRYYDPTLGRYITSDPVGLIAGNNTYNYANSNSLVYYDPEGRILPIIALAAAGAIAGAVINTYITIVANDGNVTSSQIFASLASGAIAGGIGALAAPLAGTIVGTGAGLTSLAVGAGIAGTGGALGQATANAIDPCNESSIIQAGLFGAAGFGIFGALAPTPLTSNSLAQLNSFGSSFTSLMTAPLFNSPNPQTTQLAAGIIVSSAIGAAANF